MVSLLVQLQVAMAVDLCFIHLNLNFSKTKQISVVSSSHQQTSRGFQEQYFSISKCLMYISFVSEVCMCMYVCMCICVYGFPGGSRAS